MFQVSLGALNYCYALLKSLKTEWIEQMHSSEQSTQKLSLVPPELQPDLSPLFNARVLNVNPGNVFSMYTTLLVEMALRLPYQVNFNYIFLLKVCDVISSFSGKFHLKTK